MATNNKGWTRKPSRRKRRQQRIQRYWQDRETDNRLERLKRAGAYDKEIERLYKQMLSEIQKEIDAFYQKYADDEGITMAEAKRRASKLDMEAYAQKAERYVAEKNFSKQANAEMKLYNMTMKANRLELLKAQIGLEMVSTFDDLEKLFGEKITAETIAEFKRQAGILGESVLKNASSSNINALINGSFHNASFSERIWAHQDLLRAELDKLLTRGIIGGRNPRELARELRKVIDSSIYNSERLLRTEMARVQTEAQKNAYEENGFGEFMFIACGNRDVCEICKALDGQTFKLKDMEPGTNAPPMHPNCHCSTASYEDDDEYEAWLSYLENGGTTEDWNAFAKDEWEANRAAKLAAGIPTDDETICESRDPIDASDRAQVDKTLANFAKHASNLDHEEAVIILPNGHVWHCIGGKDGVDPTVIGESLANAVMSHNHPDSVTQYALSKLDLNLYLEHEMKELRGFDSKFTYWFDRSGKVDPLIDNVFDSTEYDSLNEVIKREALANGIGYRRKAK